ncbi:hypothetical protein PVK06_026584 [Gossypium arboreum]|uniref:Small ribosomal subunit protein uS3c n=1 Tax=Gossypium arboreum TaxID=29729 RepID=A0ABR0NZD1_GOSAR|nr:hypothetical protein PVK06_026584 [Gossypium arboreum]
MRLSSGVEGIARIEIQKRLDLIQVIIYMRFPKLLIEDKQRKHEELQMNVQKELNCMNLKLNIAIIRIGNPYGHPNILAEFIARQLKNRVSFRKAMKKAIESTEQADTKGIQIQIAGRIDGKEIARVEWIREVAQGKLGTILCGRSETSEETTRPIITLRSHSRGSSTRLGTLSSSSLRTKRYEPIEKILFT